MTLTLVLLAIIMATVIGWLWRQTLNVQPWDANDPIENQPGRGVINTDPARIGLLSFIAVVTSLFALFLSAYLMRMRLGDWRPLAEPNLLWLNDAGGPPMFYIRDLNAISEHARNWEIS